ncbi:MAG TPA: SH3 domain-containing protein [Anaerolineaceae bacterium]|nr:SH3 domain-containing protein [Anaerolineaceae bacterium]
MSGRSILFICIIILTAGVMAFLLLSPVGAQPLLQQPTKLPTLATVTGTPSGVVLTVGSGQDQINVRSGPGVFYPKVGVLLAGQNVVAKGRSPGGDWILIDYPGVAGGTAWVYSYLMVVPQNGFIPVVELPPTPTPAFTITIDPTLASQFIVTTAPTRLPTFTPPPPLQIPTLPPEQGSTPISEGIPMGMVIIGLGSLGIFLGLVSLLRGR